MKTKILSQLFLLASLGIIYITMSSDSNGRAMSGTNCGSCHGSKNTATTVLLSGLPSSYVPGQTYPLTFAVTNTTNSFAGCNIAATAGTFAAGTGTKLKSSQITHISPKAAVSNVTTFTCSWTAPATTGAVTINAVGNAVNNNGSDDSGDQWNTTSVTISGAWPTTINDVASSIIACYPNPANNFIIIEGITSKTNAVVLHDVYGQTIVPSCNFDSSNCRIDCSSLSAGLYFISANVNGKIMQTSFVKN